MIPTNSLALRLPFWNCHTNNIPRTSPLIVVAVVPLTPVDKEELCSLSQERRHGLGIPSVVKEAIHTRVFDALSNLAAAA